MDQHLYRSGYSGQTHQKKKIPHREGKYLICILGQQINNLGMFSSPSVTCWGRWCPGQQWRWLWSQLSVLVGWRCTYSFESRACLRILCAGNLAWRASVRVVSTKNSQVPFYHILHLFIARELNTPLLLLSDLSAWCFDISLRFPYCGAWKPSLSHFRHIHGQAHVRLFQLYTTFLPCHHSRHVEYLQEFSCCFKQ